MSTIISSIPSAMQEFPAAPDHELIGYSRALRSVLEAVRLVAPTDATVLIEGETGTGKELIARAIHRYSQRQSGPYVTLNCTTIPGELVESELFGHERGAFTGAVNQTTGRFQLADRGTLFLDEVGDLPLSAQPKLLRVLQEGEIERLGSARTVRVDVRVIAATNQTLSNMVRDHRFRADLLYRLNVFPIRVPPLRERSEDIPMLVRHFVRKSADRMNKTITGVPENVMDAFRRYHWPGNIRELEHFIERAVILSPGSVLRAPIGELSHVTAQNDEPANRTLAEAERDHIVRVLDKSDWVVGGRDGAAVRLGVPRTTLLSRMRKLGIERVKE